MAKRSWVRRALGVGVLAGAAYAVWRAIEANRPAGDTDWEAQPFPFPPQPRTAATTGAGSEPWVEPVDGACPASHPVKVARSSNVFHVPDGQMYDRTAAVRCYRDAAAAEADGLRRSKR